jgi:hypothetical protein
MQGGPTGADLQPQLLTPVSNNNKNAPPILHARGPSAKRVREDTPSPEKVAAPQGNPEGYDWHGRIDKDTEWAKEKIKAATKEFKTDKIVNLGESVKEFFNKTLVSIFERQASTSSDLATEVIRLTGINANLTRQLEKQGEDLAGVKLCKERVEVKTSKKEMEEKIKVSVTQVKISDLDLGKESTDRKEIATAAKEAIATKVRSDLRKEFDERIKHASLKIVSSRTFKREIEGKQVWTAPAVIVVPDRENRWAIENCLRSSKMYPGFHWPREMVDNVKVFRKVVKDMGYPDSSFYIRIRPEDRDGTWKIRADVKPKEGQDVKFVSVASFDIPPLDENLKKFIPGWAKPTWVRKAAGAAGGTGTAPTTGGSADDVIDFTEDDVIYNM